MNQRCFIEAMQAAEHLTSTAESQPLSFSGGTCYTKEMSTDMMQNRSQESEAQKQAAAFKMSYLLCSAGPKSLNKTMATACSSPSSLPEVGRKQHLCNKSNLHTYRPTILGASGRPRYKTRKRPYIWLTFAKAELCRRKGHHYPKYKSKPKGT